MGTSCFNFCSCVIVCRSVPSSSEDVSCPYVLDAPESSLATLRRYLRLAVGSLAFASDNPLDGSPGHRWHRTVSWLVDEYQPQKINHGIMAGIATDFLVYYAVIFGFARCAAGTIS